MGWLDEVPKHVIDFWLAFDAIEPIGDAWEQTAEINAKLSQILGLVAFGVHGAVLDSQTAEDNMPTRYARTKKRLAAVQTKPATKSEFEQLTASFGLSEVVRKHGRIN